ncbi:xanthine dehydrogenase family protein subunit M [candidate division KSB1 bacterium]|nr:xanthine dehydrogenase family protein subunit M [candidate division KSB1 bacterium]NIR71630.1 xanthine dehydrogenase family protein subunit M [candidate division KSB1 bacterium]NIS26367.1 xanthine dehydrogenase family protein subunit M [candidate division KSB1 bacterium]NIT74983.1 xanthine dehydrogenase family protein subunit M [candidate division KSB1 bacterium]NIU27050.1 xanthine dehydrogenase family protein subunit M [candidate division KSB1 bacterium]
MKPAPFKYFVPATLEEVLSHLAEYGDEAKLLAGGQSLVPTMNFRLAQPSVLIDLNRVEELFYIRAEDAQDVRIGAMTRQREVERDLVVAQKAPLVHETMPFIAHPQIRNRGTFGGSLAHADPAAELPAVMVALNAKFLLRSEEEERWVPASEFYEDLFLTVLEPEEILHEVSIPELPPKTGWAFREIARRSGDFALVGVAVLVQLDNKEQCQDTRIVYLSVGNGPVEAQQATQALVGKKPSARTIKEAADIAAGKDIDPPGDLHASPAYRRQLAKVLTEQALTQAFERAKNA